MTHKDIVIKAIDLLNTIHKINIEILELVDYFEHGGGAVSIRIKYGNNTEIKKLSFNKAWFDPTDFKLAYVENYLKLPTNINLDDDTIATLKIACYIFYLGKNTRLF